MGPLEGPYIEDHILFGLLSTLKFTVRIVLNDHLPLLNI